jgi:hypothetical protein
VNDLKQQYPASRDLLREGGRVRGLAFCFLSWCPVSSSASLKLTASVRGHWLLIELLIIIIVVLVVLVVVFVEVGAICYCMLCSHGGSLSSIYHQIAQILRKSTLKVASLRGLLGLCLLTWVEHQH